MRPLSFLPLPILSRLPTALWPVNSAMPDRLVSVRTAFMCMPLYMTILCPAVVTKTKALRLGSGIDGQTDIGL